MKKLLAFCLMATALLFMLAAMPSTAGPIMAPLALIESALPAVLVSPAEALSVPAPASPLAISSSSVPVLTLAPSAPLIAPFSTKADLPLHAAMAALAALMGVGLTGIATRLSYDIRDRMHGLPRDQDAPA